MVARHGKSGHVRPCASPETPLMREGNGPNGDQGADFGDTSLPAGLRTLTPVVSNLKFAQKPRLAGRWSAIA
jgi:hypothetical protein